MIYRIVHRTTYKYKYPVSVGNHVACLKPRSLPRHRLAQSELHIEPSPATITERVDYFGNHLCFFTIEEPHDELVVEARSEVIMEQNADSVAAAVASLGRCSPDAAGGSRSRGAGGLAIPIRVPAHQAEAGVCLLCSRVVYRQATDARGPSGFDCTDSQGLSIRLKSDKCANAG